MVVYYTLHRHIAGRGLAAVMLPKAAIICCREKFRHMYVLSKNLLTVNIFIVVKSEPIYLPG